MTRQHTRHGPARYLSELGQDDIRATEAMTAKRPDRWRGIVPAKTEYLRKVGEVIGWDCGEEATLSYVECSGGQAARSFHGRPMHAGNPKTRLDWLPEKT